jgi:hypothetical protein
MDRLTVDRRKKIEKGRRRGCVDNKKQGGTSRCDYRKGESREGLEHPFKSCCDEQGHWKPPLCGAAQQYSAALSAVDTAHSKKENQGSAQIGTSSERRPVRVSEPPVGESKRATGPEPLRGRTRRPQLEAHMATREKRKPASCRLPALAARPPNELLMQDAVFLRAA